MSQEEKIKQELINRFSYLENIIKIQRPRRMSAEIDYNNFTEILDYAVKQLKFIHLCTITGLDEQDKLGFIYHLAQDSGVLFNLKTSVFKQNPEIKSVMPYFAGAEIYERELVDLLGVKVEGLPVGNRYPLTDDWPTDQFPLRKDWKPSSDK
ncbi:MAG: NADH-quinone oxidoreductase subunit C [Candidatus Omnitrophica bacterium]|nr:NADH-quinone oxidoreductase subunit C [Candidatus Omnitrophota bacterium]MDD5352102.1 NADH-quinone oxidoreductase subunit C [Candidatus Omnitrophota bacterium]MDD5549700.1 NADH-quinone oxidoreductase subunit C [Candidatus Omnitrophota bacterium]